MVATSFQLCNTQDSCKHQLVRLLFYFEKLYSYYCKDAFVSGKGRGGFEPLPSAEPPALAAARKSREQKNKIAIKIGAVVVLITAAVASLAAFLITRGDPSQVIFFWIKCIPRYL